MSLWLRRWNRGGRRSRRALPPRNVGYGLIARFRPYDRRFRPAPINRHQQTCPISKIRSGNFPAPIRLGSQSVGWFEAEITAWIDAQREKRDQAIKT
jgi:hypothetical protein